MWEKVGHFAKYNKDLESAEAKYAENKAPHVSGEELNQYCKAKILHERLAKEWELLEAYAIGSLKRYEYCMRWEKQYYADYGEKDDN